MAETTLRYHTETGKPLHLSVAEFCLMDRHEAKAFMKPLTKKEQWEFSKAYLVAVNTMPLEKQRELSRKRIEKLEKRPNRSIGDRWELWWARLYHKLYMVPEKKRIFFRKFQQKREDFPRWVRYTKSPYLIAPK